MQRWDSFADSEIGMSAEDRDRRAAKARSVCHALVAITIVVSLWLWIDPIGYPLPVLLMLAIPWVAVWVTAHYKGIVVINEKKRDPRPGVGLAFMWSCLLLAPQALFRMHLLEWKRPLLLGLLVAVLLTFAVWQADVALRRQPWAALIMLLVAIAYGYGATMETNAIFDRSRTMWYQPVIVSKHISRGSKGGSSYYFRLEPWGPQESEDNVRVSQSFYDAKQPGDFVCIGLRDGALNMPWYFVRDCR